MSDKGKVVVLRLDGLDTLVIKQDMDTRFFITTKDSIIISERNLILILNYMITNGYMSPKLIQGMLEELYTC